MFHSMAIPVFAFFLIPLIEPTTMGEKEKKFFNTRGPGGSRGTVVFAAISEITKSRALDFKNMRS